MANLPSLTFKKCRYTLFCTGNRDGPYAVIPNVSGLDKTAITSLP